MSRRRALATCGFRLAEAGGWASVVGGVRVSRSRLVADDTQRPRGGTGIGRLPDVAAPSAAHALHDGSAAGVAVELDDECAVVGVAELFGDDPWLDLQDVEGVAGAHVAQLVEVELVVGVECETLAQVVAAGQLARELCADRVPGAPPGLATELSSALAVEDEVVVEAAWESPDGVWGGSGT
jgi:hypothetical protein